MIWIGNYIDTNLLICVDIILIRTLNIEAGWANAWQQKRYKPLHFMNVHMKNHDISNVSMISNKYFKPQTH